MSVLAPSPASRLPSDPWASPESRPSVCSLLPGPCFPDQGSKLHALQWKLRVLTTGPPGSH